MVDTGVYITAIVAGTCEMFERLGPFVHLKCKMRKDADLHPKSPELVQFGREFSPIFPYPQTTPSRHWIMWLSAGSS